MATLSRVEVQTVMEWCDRLFPDQSLHPAGRRDLGAAISLLAQYVCLMDWKYFSLFLGGSGDHSIPMIDVSRTDKATIQLTVVPEDRSQVWSI